jgi:phage terminase large subunit
LTTKVKVQIPPKLIPIFAPARGALRYRGAYGGRGSGKSFTFAKMAAIWGYKEPLRILCARELQVSIKESMHAEIKNAILSEPWLAAGYEIGENFIRGKNGTEFIFKGLRHNMSSIKSMAQVDLCIIEEAEDTPEYSYIELEPTIRAPKSEIWVIWNPKKDGSPTDTRFKKNAPPRSVIAQLNWRDNPWFDKGTLEEQRVYNKSTMEDAVYEHVWEGAYLKHSKAQIFTGKYAVRDFDPEPHWDGPYHGIDFGFAQDPSTGVKCWVGDDNLYVEYEGGRVGLELDDTVEYLSKKIPGIENYPSRADSARPESISYLRRHGMPRMEGVKKWPGSVEDGIEHIKSYKQVVIHSRCTGTLQEFRDYSYKVDRLTGDIMPVIVDDNNHYIDAIRYAINPMIQRKGFIFA